MSFRLLQNLSQLYNTHTYMSTTAENLVKFGPVNAEIFVRYAHFCRLVYKVTVTTGIISGVSGPILIKFAQSVAKILPFNKCKSELQYSNPFRNTSVLNKGYFANLAQNWLPWQCPLRNRKKRSRSIKTHLYLLFGKIIVKIGPVDPE